MQLKNLKKILTYQLIDNILLYYFTKIQRKQPKNSMRSTKIQAQKQKLKKKEISQKLNDMKTKKIKTFKGKPSTN